MSVKFASSLLLTLLLPLCSYAQVKNIPLYTGPIPNSKQATVPYVEQVNDNGYVSHVSIPELIPFFPKKKTSNGTAVIICPGGGYQLIVTPEEGEEVAREFNKIGVTAFVLKYRLPNDTIMIDKSIGPIQDVQRAIQLLRKRASEWNIDPRRIGVVGLSAGGHLASTAGTHFDKAFIENKENISLRPDFMVLIYPVISFSPLQKTRTMVNLLGRDPSEAARDYYSNEKQVTAQTPPTFLVHAADDARILVQHSLLFHEALLRMKVKTELHIFQDGGHGFGLENPNSKSKWFDWCRNWLAENGLVKN
ncbi:MAG: alpha/beta hydrolase [Cyclobacteriaceae bacterium]|nr:alpha/beta hydrolase [Cyclobacteriaceae bacterium]